MTVTCLMPGATDTDFFVRADMMETKVGFDARMDGEADVVAGLKNRLQVALAKVTSSQMLAEQHRKKAQPGTGDKA